MNEARQEKWIDLKRRAVDWYLSKKGLLATGIPALVLAILTVFVFVFCSVYHADPSLLQSQEFCSIRTETLEQGNLINVETVYGSIRTEKVHQIQKGDVFYTVSPATDASDYYEFSFDEPWSVNDRQFLHRTIICNSTLVMSGTVAYPFGVEVKLLTPQGKTPVTPEGLTSSVHLEIDYDENLKAMNTRGSNRHGLLNEEEWGLCQTSMVEKATWAISHFGELAEKVGFTDGKAFVANAVHVFRATEALHKFSYVAMPSSVLMVVMLSLFLGAVVAKKAIKHGSTGLAALIDPVHERPEPTVAEPKDYTLGKRSAAIASFFERHNIHPVLGEWFFRAFGLFFVGISSIFLSLFARSQFADWGTMWNLFSEGSAEYFRVFYSLGSVILIIIVIGIVTETRRNLNISAWAFMTLAFCYYFGASAYLFSKELALGRFGATLADALAPTLPGNVFLGIGLFTIIGFFLFYDPPETMIRRKLFRGLVAIPIALAIVSMVFTYLYLATDYSPSFWIRNFFFIRSANILFIGILYEVSIFFVYKGLAKRRGEKTIIYDTVTPFFQFQKNAALCILLLLFVAIFYIIPADQRAYFGLDTQHAFYYFLVPFFFFFKPAGLNHKKSNDYIYYVLYAVVWALGSLPIIVDTISSFVG